MSDKIEVDFTILAIVLAVALFKGEPDLIDALIFNLTGVQNWVTLHQ